MSWEASHPTRACSGAPCLAPWIWKHWADPPLPSGQMKRGRRYRAGPVAAGGQGAGPCGALVGHPPGHLVSLTQVRLWGGGTASPRAPTLPLGFPSVHPKRPPSLRGSMPDLRAELRGRDAVAAPDQSSPGAHRPTRVQGEWPCGQYPVLVDLPGIHPSQAHAGDLAHALRPSQAPRLEPLHEEELPKGPNSVSLGEGQAAGCGARRRSRSEEVPGLAPAMASVLHTHLLQAWPSTGRHLLCDPAEICSSVNISVPHLKVLKAGSGTVWMKADSGSRKWYHSAVAGLRQLLGNEKRRMESGTWAGVRGWVGRSPTSGQLGLVQAKKARILLGATAVPRPLPCPIPADWAASLASTSSWPRGRCRWQRKPCRTSTMPCAAMWTSQGPRAIACSESSAG